MGTDIIEFRCMNCEYRFECDIATDYFFCEDCAQYNYCTIKNVCCKAGYEIECNNDFTPKDECWEENREDDNT